MAEKWEMTSSDFVSLAHISYIHITMKSVDEELVGLPPPRTWMVLATLAGAALLASWLVAYGVSGALIKSELLRPFSHGHDPRALWMTELFLGLLAAFILLGGLFRWLSRRQLARIDRMVEE
jgi:hypothetical protein